jgi:anti-sigma-K factor RskA
LARVDEPSATAARQILGLPEVTYAESGRNDNRVQALLQSFYSMAQLTAEAPIPEHLATRVLDRPAAGEDNQAPQSRTRSSETQSIASRLLSARIRIPTTALVMLVAALVLSIGANVLLSRTSPFRPESAIHMVGTGSSPDARGVLLFDGGQTVLHASGLAELAEGYRYVAWSAAETQPRYLGSLTMLGNNNARLLASADAVKPVIVVTIEPSASPASPSGPQILVGRRID